MNIQEEIEQRNAAFAEKTPKEKAVLIAQDVIKMLRIKRIYAQTGDYFSSSLNKKGVGKNNAREEFLGLFSNNESCSCCALGAVMLSCTLFANNETYSQFYREVGETSGYFENGLHEIFSTEQLQLIERSFEGWWGYYYYSTKYNDSNERLEAIMQNIIDNNGAFIYPS